MQPPIKRTYVTKPLLYLHLKIISFYYVNIFSVKSGEPVQTNKIFFIKQKSIYYTMIISHDNSKFLTYRQFEKLHKETSVPCTH